MLVLSRKSQEQIIITVPGKDGAPDDVIELTVLSLENEKKGKKVRLGLQAPRHIQINRKEVSQKTPFQSAEEKQWSDWADQIFAPPKPSIA